MTFQKRQALFDARTAKGYSRPKLAEKVGVTFEHIKKLESGRSRPSAMIMVKICHALESTPEELFQDIIS